MTRKPSRTNKERGKTIGIRKDIARMNKSISSDRLTASFEFIG